MNRNADTPGAAGPFLFVDTPRGLAELLPRLEAEPFIAVDTEFIRERTYFPRPCLFQVANDSLVACIDPLALEDLAPLFALLLDDARLKVIHAARQDLEIFFHATGKVPAPLFDTQIAASLSGLGDQIGYGQLVTALLGVRVDKAHTRTDWSRRPLSDAQCAYAADDVRYLVALYHALEASLARGGRAVWLEEDCARLTEPALYDIEPEQSWRRVKGARRLSGHALVAVRKLAAWREDEARRRDKPRQWLVRDAVLVRLAQALPTGTAALTELGLSASVRTRHGRDLVALVGQARAQPAPDDAAPDRLTGAQERLVGRLLQLVRERGGARGVSPPTLATRQEVTRLVRGERGLQILDGWRYEVVGRELLELVEAEASG